MKIGFGQFNPVMGDIDGNKRKIISAYETCVKQGAELIIFPELAITGYPPEDLLFKFEFIRAEQEALLEIAQKCRDVPVILGATHIQSGNLYNAAYIIHKGRVNVAAQKTHLPNYGVFDEKRYFTASYLVSPVVVNDKKIGVLICEDMWSSEKTAQYVAQGVEMFVAINASPFESFKTAMRHEVAAVRVKETGIPLVYVNMVGGQDELVFDGGSFVMNEKAEIVSVAPEFKEFIGIPNYVKPMGINESRYNAMCLGLKDYVLKNGFSKVVLGLSGGIDSALVAVIAADALGKDNVRLVMLPSKFTSKESFKDAEKMAKELGIPLENIDIEPAVKSYEKMLKALFKGKNRDLTEENLQSRVRGTALMAISNKFNELLLTTGNKSEIATGYSTLYGDSCGAFNPIKDLYKTEVYEIAKWLGRIPQNIIDKAPTAELRENQKDQDSLPPYDVLDKILKGLIEETLTIEELIEDGFDKIMVQKVAKLLKFSEYKRRQSAPGVKLSKTAFGRDWRMPLTNKF